MSESPTVKFKKLVDIPLDKIDVSAKNVRKSQREKGLEELKGSIEKRGLIHPIIVMPKGDRFELIVGQRRFLATQELGWKSIPALIIDRMDEVGATVVSFGENIHRRKLPYDDTIKVCDTLFKQYDGSSSKKINQIARDLGLSRVTVIRYLSYMLVPDQVREMVSTGQLSAKVAYDITSAFWPNDEKIIKIAEYAQSLTSAEIGRAIDIGRSNPKVTPEEVVDEAKKPPTMITFTISMPVNVYRLLNSEAVKRRTDVGELILTSITRYLEEGGA